MKEDSSTTHIATLTGIRPILFDRYAGDNNTTLPVEDKGYRNQAGEYGIPILNVFSLLAAENTPSVAKRFHGKKARSVALGVMAFVNIEAIDGDDTLFAPLTDEKGGRYMPGDSRISVVRHVARLAKGVPNPKERPMITPGWKIRLRFTIQDPNEVNFTARTLKQMVQQGGILGLGTFRPIFGRYSVEWAE